MINPGMKAAHTEKQTMWSTRLLVGGGVSKGDRQKES